MLMMVISSPQNLARLERLRTISTMLARGEGVDQDQAKALAAEGRAFVWIDAGLHSTEAIAGQNLIELIWQMNARDDEEVRRILDEVERKPVHLITAEDLILFKLLAGRPRDLLDIEDVFFMQSQLDEAYMRRWAGPLGVADQLERMLGER
jgi:hypothetical protein